MIAIGLLWLYNKDLDYQKFFFRSEMDTDKFILIVERGFKSFLSNKNASPEDLEYAKMLLIIQLHLQKTLILSSVTIMIFSLIIVCMIIAESE